jgi:hypothetical protein
MVVVVVAGVGVAQSSAEQGRAERVAGKGACARAAIAQDLGAGGESRVKQRLDAHACRGGQNTPHLPPQHPRMGLSFSLCAEANPPLYSALGKQIVGDIRHAYTNLAMHPFGPSCAGHDGHSTSCVRRNKRLLTYDVETPPLVPDEGTGRVDLDLSVFDIPLTRVDDGHPEWCGTLHVEWHAASVAFPRAEWAALRTTVMSAAGALAAAEGYPVVPSLGTALRAYVLYPPIPGIAQGPRQGVPVTLRLSSFNIIRHVAATEPVLVYYGGNRVTVPLTDDHTRDFQLKDEPARVCCVRAPHPRPLSVEAAVAALRQAVCGGDDPEVAAEAVQGSFAAVVDAFTSTMSETVLCYAVRRKRTRTIQWLLARGADPNARRGGYTAVHAAASTGDVSILRQILDAGGDAAATTQQGYSTLHAVAQSGSQVCAEVLLASGAARALAFRGCSCEWAPAHEVAREHGHTHLATLLHHAAKSAQHVAVASANHGAPLTPMALVV